MIILLISSVVGKVECLRETEKRSVTPSSLWNNKRVKEIHCEKFISHPDLMIKMSFSENKKTIIFFHISAVGVRKGACAYVDTRS